MVISTISLAQDTGYEPEIYFGDGEKLLLLASRLKKALWSAQEIELAREDLTVPQWLILSGLAANKMATLTQLSRALSYNAGSLSRVIQQLKVRNLVVVGSDPDRRRTPLSLSDTGLALCTAVEARFGKLKRLLATIPEYRRATPLLDLMARAIVELEEECSARGKNLLT